MAIRFIPQKSDNTYDKDMKKLFLDYLNKNYPEWKEEIPAICCAKYQEGVKDYDWINWVDTHRIYQVFLAGYESKK